MSKDVNNISNRSSLQKACKNVDSEYIKKLWQFSIEVAKIGNKRVETEEEMIEHIQQLFDLCSRTGNVPTYESLALACGIPSRTFYDISYNKGREGYKRYAEIIEQAKEQITILESAMVRDGKIPAEVWKFRAKNYLKMKDVQQVEAVSIIDETPKSKSEIIASLPEIPAEEIKTIEGKASSEIEN